MWFYSLKPLEQTKTYPTSAILFLVHLFFSFLQCLRPKSAWDWVSALTLSCNPSPWPQACLCPGHQCLEASKQASWTTCGCLLNLRSTDVLFCKIGNNELMRVDLRETMWKKLVVSLLAIGDPWGKLISFQIISIQEVQNKQSGLLPRYDYTWLKCHQTASREVLSTAITSYQFFALWMSKVFCEFFSDDEGAVCNFCDADSYVNIVGGKRFRHVLGTSKISYALACSGDCSLRRCHGWGQKPWRGHLPQHLPFWFCYCFIF